MPWYLFLFSSVFAGTPVGGLEEDMRPGIRTESFWKRERFATRSRLNGVEDSWLERMGWMKRGQRRRLMERKERMSRPECLDRES